MELDGVSARWARKLVLAVARRVRKGEVQAERAGG